MDLNKALFRAKMSSNDREIDPIFDLKIGFIYPKIGFKLELILWIYFYDF